MSISSNLSEHQVCFIIDEFLNESSLKSPSQWGFTKGLSAEGMLLTMTDRWKMDLDKGMSVGAIFVDFRKVFDSISHNILSLKLQAVGLSGDLHEWLMHYLKDRYQCTVVNGCASDLDLVQYGVPQGSLLGPRLYTIYVNDLPDAITLGDVLMYADDTTIYCVLNRVINVESSVSKDSFKQIIRKFSKDINNFTFKAPMIVKKDDNFIYF